MERKPAEFFDARGFLDLLGDSLGKRLLDHEALTGVLVARIHVRAGEPWAVSAGSTTRTRGPHHYRRNRRPYGQEALMTQIKCSFCPKTIEARLWPDEKETAWMGSDSRPA
jgi:hypothetical protein